MNFTFIQQGSECSTVDADWGKTVAGANEFIRQIWRQGEGKEKMGIVGFAVAPTYWHTQRQWSEFFNFCPPELIEEIHRTDRHVTLKGKRHVWFKSADNPDSLRSQGVKVLWVDEGAQISEEAWTMALRPSLMDEKGIAVFTGTPRGHNWYFRLWNMEGKTHHKPTTKAGASQAATTRIWILPRSPLSPVTCPNSLTAKKF